MRRRSTTVVTYDNLCRDSRRSSEFNFGMDCRDNLFPSHPFGIVLAIPTRIGWPIRRAAERSERMNAWPTIQTRLRQSGRQLLLAAALLIALLRLLALLLPLLLWFFPLVVVLPGQLPAGLLCLLVALLPPSPPGGVGVGGRGGARQWVAMAGWARRARGRTVLCDANAF